MFIRNILSSTYSFSAIFGTQHFYPRFVQASLWLNECLGNRMLGRRGLHCHYATKYCRFFFVCVKVRYTSCFTLFVQDVLNQSQPHNSFILDTLSTPISRLNTCIQFTRSLLQKKSNVICGFIWLLREFISYLERWIKCKKWSFG